MPNKQPNRRPWQSKQISGFSKQTTTYKRRERDPFISTKAWKLTRAKQLAEYPLCEHCELLSLITPATVVDHIHPRRLGGAEYSPSNLQSLCASCHNRKSRYENNQSK